MYARVTSWEGGDAEAIRANVEDISRRAPTGPPEGVPSVGFTLLVDPDSGRTMMIGMFETLEDLETGDAALQAMSPPVEGLGTRGQPAVYEVAVDLRL
jgi:hypothetical protein